MEALIEYAHAIGRARSGDLAGARQAMDRMRQLGDATTGRQFDFFRMHLKLQLQAATAWVEFGEGEKADALNRLIRTAKAEDDLGKHPVSPGALVPVREQLGDLLLEIGRPQEALVAFEAALKIYPGRFRGLYGARSELAHVREYLAMDTPVAKPASVADAGN